MKLQGAIFPLLLFPIVFLAPILSLERRSDRAGVLLRLESQDEHVVRCIESGLEVRYRLEYQICLKSGSWFDSCSDPQLVARSVQYDPVSESYRIKTDSLADTDPATVILETDPDLAFTKISEFFLPDTRALPEQPPSGYLSARIRGYCQREEQSLLTQIPYYLTLGIFRFTGFDTGWIDFSLQ